MDDDFVLTVCDRCSCTVPLELVSTPEAGEWDGASLCSDCYAAQLAEDADD